jgi:hypothetical protein
MKTANYDRLIGFMAKMESAATTPREKEVINSARGIFAKFEGTAATMDVNMASKSRTPEFSMMQHGGSNIKPMTQEEKDAFNADVDARNKQWNRQLGSMKRRVKNAEHTLEEYAEIAPGELDAWVENTLRPTIEEYLDSEEGGLVWADENKKKVKRERGAGGFITPAMKRAKYDEDKKKWLDERAKAKEEKEAAEKKAKEAEKKAEETEVKEEPKEEPKEDKPKKRGFFGKLKDAVLGGEAKLGGALESVSTADLRACFESVFGNSDHLSDNAVRAICINALDRKFR